MFFFLRNEIIFCAQRNVSKERSVYDKNGRSTNISFHFSSSFHIPFHLTKIPKCNFSNQFEQEILLNKKFWSNFQHSYTHICVLHSRILESFPWFAVSYIFSSSLSGLHFLAPGNIKSIKQIHLFFLLK